LDRFNVKVVGSNGQNVGGVGQVHGSWSTAAISPSDHVLLGSAFSINAEQQPYPLRDPGEPVTGVLSNLYPF
jgi:hypothetical protein